MWCGESGSLGDEYAKARGPAQTKISEPLLNPKSRRLVLIYICLALSSPHIVWIRKEKKRELKGRGRKGRKRERQRQRKGERKRERKRKRKTKGERNKRGEGKRKRRKRKKKRKKKKEEKRKQLKCRSTRFKVVSVVFSCARSGYSIWISGLGLVQRRLTKLKDIQLCLYQQSFGR